MEKLFLVYLNAGFFGGVIILVGLLLRPLLRNAPRRFLCIVWLLAAVRLLLPINLESSFSLQPRFTPTITVLSQQEQQAQTPVEPPVTNPIVSPSPVLPEVDSEIDPLPPEKPVIPGTPVQPVPDIDPVVPEPPIVENPTPAEPMAVNVMQIIAIIWVMVMAAVYVYGLVSYLVLKRRVKTAVRCADGTLESERISSAFLLGYFKPEIYLPVGLSEQDRAFMIAHEQAHIRRRDHWWKLLGLMCVGIHWYNPLVWIGYALMCRDIEIACDEQVVQSMSLEERKAYSLALLNSGKRLSGMLACPVAFGEVSLKQRIKKVLAYRQPKFWMTAIAISLVVFVALCFLTSPDTEPEAGPSLQAGETKPSSGPEEETGGTDTAPSVTQPTEPSVTQPTEPAATQPTEPPATQPTKPPSTKPQEDKVDPNIIAQGKVAYGPLQWTITVDGTLRFFGGTGFQGTRVIPWHDYADIVTRIVVEDGPRRIPSNAFKGMYMVETVYLGNTLTEINESAFENCTSLKAVTIPAAVTEIHERAFYGCTSLSKLEFAPGSQISIIDKQAFYGSGLISFESPATLKEIGFNAFEDSKALQTLILTGDLEVKAYAFSGCDQIKYVKIGEGVSGGGGGSSMELEMAEFYSGKNGFGSCSPKLHTVIIGGKISRITHDAFDGCIALKKVVISAPIKEIGSSAFEGCSGLTELTIPNTVTEIGSYAFCGCGITQLTIPASVTEMGMDVFENSAIQEVTFLGNAPMFMNYRTFFGTTITAYYPADNETWTEDKLQNYGGNVTWIPLTEKEAA